MLNVQSLSLAKYTLHFSILATWNLVWLKSRKWNGNGVWCHQCNISWCTLCTAVNRSAADLRVHLVKLFHRFVELFSLQLSFFSASSAYISLKADIHFRLCIKNDIVRCDDFCVLFLQLD